MPIEIMEHEGWLQGQEQPRCSKSACLPKCRRHGCCSSAALLCNAFLSKRKRVKTSSAPSCWGTTRTYYELSRASLSFPPFFSLSPCSVVVFLCFPSSYSSSSSSSCHPALLNGKRMKLAPCFQKPPKKDKKCVFYMYGMQLICDKLAVEGKERKR